MKKYKCLLIVLFLFLLTFTSNVKASRTICVYTLGDSTITINYDYNKTPEVKLDQKPYDKTIVAQVDDLKNSDFVKDGKLVCPILNAYKRGKNGKNGWKYYLSSSKEAKNGTYEGTITILEDDGAENGGIINNETVDCVYKKDTDGAYSLKWENDKVVANLYGSGYDDNCKDNVTIKSEFTKSDFEAGKCPDVYDKTVKKQGYCSVIISKNTIFTEEDIITENDNIPEPDEQTEMSGMELGRLTCDMLFQDENGNLNLTHQMLSTTLRFMQYIAVIIALVLSIVDFIKVVTTNDKDGIKKASKRAAMRLCIAILIFFVPIILDFILDLIGFNSSTCGLLK